MPRSSFILRFNSIYKVLVIIYIPISIEILLRIISPVPMMPRYVTETSYGIRGNMPNRTYRHKTADYSIVIKTNSQGIRSDKEIPLFNSDKTKRILLLGDSFGMGYGVKQDQMFTTKMTHYLKSKYMINAEIVNLSTSGHGNAEELIAFMNKGLNFHPDLVLLAWHFTDLDDNVRSNLFVLKDGMLERKSKSYLPGVKEREFLDQFYIYRFLAENSQIYNLLRNKAGTKVKEISVNLRSIKSKNRKALKKSDNSAYRGEGRDYKKELTIAILKKINDECRKRNIEFLILDIPLNKTNTTKFPYTLAKEFGITRIVSPIRKFQEEKGKKIYWERSNGHFTPFGCEIVGRELADYIYSKKMLK